MKVFRVFFILFILFLGLTSVYAQKDPKAKGILDKVSAQNRLYKTIQADFVVKGLNKQTKDKSVHKGSLVMKGKRYKLSFMDSEMYCDGKTLWNYIPASKEVTINRPSKNDDDFLSNPSGIFTFYEKNYKFKFIREGSDKGKDFYEIDLYPMLQKSYFRVKLHIEKSTLQIYSIQVDSKDGSQVIVQISKFITNVDVPESNFIFEKSHFPGVEVIDMR
jgi:outer membrane lipoprotein carrier protein